MRRQHPLSITLLISFYLLFITIPVVAQDEKPPAPQFLYRDENHLVLLDGYTGEPTQLPFEVTDQDRFVWSPDGKYLLSRLHEGDTYKYCLNLYDVDAEKWAYTEPLSCAVGDALFSADGSHIIYTSSDATNAVLWLYNLADEKSQELYRTTDGSKIVPEGISYLYWSRTQTYLTFVDYHQIMGGTVNTFVVMNIKSKDHFTVQGGGGYYASYHPIWSKDDRWFLIILKEEYVTSGALPRTNHAGDLYLINSETGHEYRLTYTPADYEGDVRWTDDGQIAFTVTVVRSQDFTYTPQQAMQVEVVPNDQIVQPEPVDPENYAYDPLSDVMMSPDPYLGAWVFLTPVQPAGHVPELIIGNIRWMNINSVDRTENFSIPLPEQYTNILIGWRPSDYPYPYG